MKKIVYLLATVCLLASCNVEDKTGTSYTEKEYNSVRLNDSTIVQLSAEKLYFYQYGEYRNIQTILNKVTIQNSTIIQDTTIVY